MICASCGHENREGAGFCGACGTSLNLAACGGCGALNPTTNAFCDACGARVAPDTEQKPSPRDYTPPHLAEKILRDRGSLAGERRTVTVLFADAVGSTPMGERLDPESVYTLMQGCAQRMMEAVHRHEGHVTQFRGDGIMALFGAPIAHEDAARRAVVAALEMQRSLGAYLEETRGRGGGWAEIECRFRVGLHTGPVVVGGIGDDLSMDLTAIGDTANLAARIEAAADPGTVLVSEATYRAGRDYVDFEPVGRLTLKGKSEPVAAYRAVAEKDVRSRFEAATVRGLTPYVGRSHELTVLAEHFRRAAAGRGQVVLVSGEAGIGKSRLLLEFRRTLPAETRWLESHCITYGTTIPYLPIVELLQAAFAIEETDDEGRIIDRVDEAVSTWPSEAQKTVPYLKFLLQIDPGDPAIEHMDPMERRAGILDALRCLVVQEAERGPLALVVEDLHWADERSTQALAALVDVIREAPVLVLLTYRPGYAHGLGDVPQAHRLALDELPGAESEELARRVLEETEVPGELAGIILEKAQGNPLFIEEVSKALVEGGVLRRTQRGLELTRPAEQVRIPDTVQDVILARIDRLEREGKEAIQLASVIGREFTVRLLERISDLREGLSGVLGELKTLELIYEKHYLPELAYMFKHALTHDVAYSTLLVERRKRLHRVVATAIEELYSDRLVEHYETLAHHHLHAEEWEKAIDYLVRSGDKAAAAYANEEAFGFYGSAMDVCERLGGEALRTLVEVAIRKSQLAQGVGAFPEAIADCDRALDAARRLGDRARRLGDRHLEGVALGWRAGAEALAHEFETAERTALEALDIAAEGFDDVRCIALMPLGLIALVLGRLPEAERHASEMLELGRRLNLPLFVGLAAMILAIAEQWAGRFDPATRTLDGGRDMMAEAGSVSYLLQFLWVESLTHIHQGEYEAALRILEHILSTAERSGEVLARARAINTVGWVHAELEDHETALEWNERDLAFALEAGFPDPEVEANARLNLADNLIALGRPEEAAGHLRVVERIVREPRSEERWMLWSYSQHFFATAGELALGRGELDRALGYADECEALATSTDRPKNIVKARRLRGRALQAKGDLDGAARELTATLEGARELGNPPQHWKAAAALGDLRRAQGREDEAHAAYAEALGVIDRVADTLEVEALRNTFLGSHAVGTIRRCVSSPNAE